MNLNIEKIKVNFVSFLLKNIQLKAILLNFIGFKNSICLYENNKLFSKVYYFIIKIEKISEH